MGVESTYRDHPYGSIFKTTTDGTGGGGGGGATPGVAVFSVNQYNTSGTGPTETPYPGASPGTEYKFASAGYYVVTIPDASDPLTFDMWDLGAGGGPGSGSWTWIWWSRRWCSWKIYIYCPRNIYIPCR